MPAASRSDQFASGSQSHNIVLDQVGSDEGGPSSVQGVISLSMMREAFAGLRKRSLSSSTEQRGELEGSKDLTMDLDQILNALKAEVYSYDSVRESDVSKFATSENRSAGASSVVASTDFFNSLTMIGGLR